MATNLELDVTITNRPLSGSVFPSGATNIEFTKQQSAQEIEHFQASLAGVTDLSVFPGRMSKVQWLWVRCTSQITLKATFGSGTAQTLTVNSVLLLDAGTSAGITALTVTGSADVEILASGE